MNTQIPKIEFDVRFNFTPEPNAQIAEKVEEAAEKDAKRKFATGTVVVGAITYRYRISVERIQVKPGPHARVAAVLAEAVMADCQDRLIAAGEVAVEGTKYRYRVFLEQPKEPKPRPASAKRGR